MKNSLLLTAPYSLENFDAIIDVRTPAEYAIDHLPQACNYPILTNEQRVEIGTLYTHDPFLAKKRGAKYVAENLAFHLEHHWADAPKKWKPLVYCWRGGMRSGSVVHCMQMIGWSATQLEGGYKKWRQWLLDDLNILPHQFTFHVLMGPTGSGKTELLKTLAAMGEQVLDLEGLANHKGSVLGEVPNMPQPSQKSFENLLYHALRRFRSDKIIWVEAESKKIGRLHIPETLMQRIRAAEGTALETSKEGRVAHIIEEYQWFYQVPELLIGKLEKLQEFISKETWGFWQESIQNHQWQALVEHLITIHYDPLYYKAQAKNYTKVQNRPITLNRVNPSELKKAAEQLIQRASISLIQA